KIAKDLFNNQESFVSEPGTVVDRTKTAAKGVGESILTLGSGAIAEPVAGVLGSIEGIESFVAGDDDPLFEAASKIEQTRNALT
ncbi:MAG: hypothetical protein GWO38_31355, partial [Phycisphaerae bacterium]|nr:hypothetical protein [Phycisphaerae bacterium]NIX32001.1 hypothetical protein [Phycisphaerae bacterium]